MHKKKIKIRFQIRHYIPMYTGAGGSLKKLIDALDKDKFDLEIITTFKKGLKKIETIDGCRVIRVGGGPFNKISGKLKGFGLIKFALFSAIYNFFHPNYDILHFIGTGRLALFSILAAKLFRKKIVNKITRVGDDDPEALKKVLFGNFIIKLLSKNSAHLIISEEILKICESSTNWHKNSLFFMPNPVEVNFDDYNGLKTKRKSCKNKNETLTFLFVGVLENHKGIDILVDLWNKNNIKSKLIICGPKRETEESEQIVKNINKSKNIIWKGKLSKEELQKEYLSADIFLFPTKREGLPNVVLEAMSFGIHVIANEIDGVTNYLLGNNNERGILIKKNKEAAWAKIINELSSSNTLPSNFEKMQKDAFLWIKSNAEASVVASKVEKMYKNLITN